MVEKGISSYMRGRGLANIGFWNRIKNTVAGKDVAESALEEFNGKMAKMISDAKEVTNGLREISKERPEFLAPLHLAWELTDGDVNTLAKLNNYVAQSLPNITKAFVDGQPEIPNLLVRGAWSNIFNSSGKLGCCFGVGKTLDDGFCVNHGRLQAFSDLLIGCLAKGE